LRSSARQSVPLASTALGALIERPRPSTVHCGFFAERDERSRDGARAGIVECRQTAADRVEQDELGAIDGGLRKILGVYGQRPRREPLQGAMLRT
jgi:hypothetical protein